MGLSPIGKAPQTAYAATQGETPAHGAKVNDNTVATITTTTGTWGYTSLATAVADAALLSSTNTVTLTSDVTLSAAGDKVALSANSATIDLAGHKVTIKTTAAGVSVSNTGALAITDSAKKSTSGIAGEIAGAIAVSGGTLDLGSVNVTTTKENVLNVTGGVVTSVADFTSNQAADNSATDNTAVINVAGGELDMTAGSITNRRTGTPVALGGITVAGGKAVLGVKDAKTGPTVNSLGYAINAKGAVDIYGGKYITDSDAVVAGTTTTKVAGAILADTGSTVNVHYAEEVYGKGVAALAQDTGVLNVYEGVFSGATAAFTYPADADTNGAVYGGTIGKGDNKVALSTAKKVLKGGTYLAAVTSDMIASTDYIATDNHTATAAATEWYVKKDFTKFAVTKADTDPTFTGLAQDYTPKSVAWNGTALDAGDYAITYFPEGTTDFSGAGLTQLTLPGKYFAKVVPTKVDDYAYASNHADFGKGYFVTPAASIVMGTASLADLETAGALTVYVSGTGANGPWTEVSKYVRDWTGTAPVLSGNDRNLWVKVNVGGADGVDIPETSTNAAQTETTVNFTPQIAALPAGNGVNVGDAVLEISAGASDTPFFTKNTATTSQKFTIKGTKALKGATTPADKLSVDVVLAQTSASDASPVAVAQDITLPTVTGENDVELSLGTGYTAELTKPGATSATTLTSATGALKKAGEYSLKVSGAANLGYSAESAKTLTYKVKPVDITNNSAVVVTKPTDSIYTYAAASTTGLVPTKVEYTQTINNVSTTVELVEGTDYTVDPKTVDSSGVKTVTLTGKGNFAGTITYNVTVAAGSFDKMTLANASGVYMGAKLAAVPSGFTAHNATTGDDDDVTAAVDDSYDLEYYPYGTTSFTEANRVDPIDVGKYTVRAVGNGGYAGSSATATFAITEADISGVVTDVRFNGGKKIAYTGQPVDLTKIVEVYGTVNGQTVKLEYGKDYDLSPREATSTTEVMVLGDGNFTGRSADDGGAPTPNKWVAEFTYSVLSDVAEITASPEGMTFKPSAADAAVGEYQEPIFTVKNKATGAELVQGVDYALDIVEATEFDSDGNPTAYNESGFTAISTTTDGTETIVDAFTGNSEVSDAGYYKVRLVGQGSYVGTTPSEPGAKIYLEGYFKVGKFDLSATTVAKKADGKSELVDDSVTFTGKAQYPVLKNKTTDTGYLNFTYKKADGTESVLKLKQHDYASDPAETAIKQFTTVAYTDVAANQPVVIEGEGNYEGEVRTDFTYSVEKAAAAPANTALQFQDASGAWVDTVTLKTGTADRPATRVVVLDAGKPVYEFKASEYDIAWAGDVTNAGSAVKGTVTFNGTGGVANGVNSVFASYKLADRSLEQANAELKVAATGITGEDTYNGAARTLTPSLVNKNGGGAIAGTIAYSYYPLGSEEAKAVSTSVSLAAASATSGEKADAGTYRFVATSSDFYGSVEGTYTIKPFDLNKATVKYADGDGTMITVGDPSEQPEAYTYADGVAIEPVVTITLPTGGSLPAIVKGKDWDVAYDNNVNAGQAKATVTGTGNFESTVEIPFAIDKAKFNYGTYRPYSMDGVLHTDAKNFGEYDYTGSAIQPKIALTSYSVHTVPVPGTVPPTFVTVEEYGKKALTEGVDYSVTYDNNVNASGVITPAMIYVTPINTDNYDGVVEIPFNINGIDIAKSSAVSASVADTEYGKEPAATVTYTPEGGKAIELKAGTDYLATYANTDKAGNTAEATIIGKGNFSNSVRKTFKITQASQTISAANKTLAMGTKLKVNASSAQKGAIAYASKTPSVATVAADGTITPVKVGKATITVTAKATADGNYKETSKDITVTVTKGASTFTASGKAKTVKYKTLKKKSVSYKASKYLKTANAKGKLTYKLNTAKKGKKSFKKYFSVASKTGKLTVKKGLAKGTYKLTVKVTDAGNANWNGKTVTTKAFNVKVK